MHTKNKGKPKKNNKTQAYSTPRAEARAGPGRGPGPGPKLGVLWACVLLFFLGFPLFLVCICHYRVGN